MKRSTDKAINKLEQLGKAAERKPSIQKTIQDLNQQIAKTHKSVSVKVRQAER